VASGQRIATALVATPLSMGNYFRTARLPALCLNPPILLVSNSYHTKFTARSIILTMAHQQWLESIGAGRIIRQGTVLVYAQYASGDLFTGTPFGIGLRDRKP